MSNAHADSSALADSQTRAKFFLFVLAAERTRAGVTGGSSLDCHKENTELSCWKVHAEIGRSGQRVLICVKSVLE